MEYDLAIAHRVCPVLARTAVGFSNKYMSSQDNLRCDFSFASPPDAKNAKYLSEEDLRLMVVCRHHVIANKTLSWWGAYIGDSDGMTVCPQEFYDGRIAAIRSETIPEDWIVPEVGL